MVLDRLLQRCSPGCVMLSRMLALLGCGPELPDSPHSMRKKATMVEVLKLLCKLFAAFARRGALILNDFVTLLPVPTSVVSTHHDVS
jgi:hypothetical protein